MPWEYIELTLCRDIYHCTPTELDEQEWERVMAHLDMYNIEMENKNMREQVAADKQKAAAARTRSRSRGRRR